MRNSRSTHANAASQTEWASVLALSVLAAFLRLWHIGHGLPDFAEEATVFRKALDLWSSGDLNPHWFLYPSLVIYLHLILQHLHSTAQGLSPANFLLSVLIDPTAPVVLARSLGVAADIVTLVMVGRMARRYGVVPGLVAMALVALAPTLIATSRLLYTDSVMCALSVSAIERMMAYLDRGGRGRAVAAALLVGLATGAKYTAVLLAVPLAIAVLRRERAKAPFGTLALVWGTTAIAFLATTPYLLVSWSEFTRDAIQLHDITGGGGLGKLEGTAFTHNLTGLASNLGWIGVAFMVVSLVAARRHSDRSVLLLLWAAWIVLFVPVSLVPVEAERYLVPLIALGAVLAAIGIAQGLSLVRTQSRLVTLGIAAIAVAQPIVPGITAAAAGRTATEIESRKWCEAHLGIGDLVLSEIGGPRLLTHSHRAQVMAGGVFQSASPNMQSAFASRRAYSLVWLPLIVSGYGSVTLPTYAQQELDVYPHVVDWNAAVYDARLLKGVDYVVTTGAVRGRFESDPGRFPEQRRFYALLDSTAERVAYFESSHGVEGAGIAIYHLSNRARAEIGEGGLLDSLWWTRTVPQSFKDEATRMLAAGVDSTAIVPGLPSWMQALRPAYSQRYGAFVDDLAENLAALGRHAEAERLCLSGLAVMPEDQWALQIYAVSARAVGHETEMRRVIDRSRAVLAR